MKPNLATIAAILASFFLVEPIVWGQLDKTKEKIEQERREGFIEFNKLEVKGTGRDWIVATLQITPKLDTLRKNKQPPPPPTLIQVPQRSRVVNPPPKIFEEVKIDVYLCFKNYRRYEILYEETGRDPPLDDYLDYYHAQVEFLALGADGAQRTLEFYLPLSIAKRDFFEKVTDQVMMPYFGHVVDISIGNVSMLKEIREHPLMKSRTRPTQIPLYFGWLMT
ncbi:MAG: hypothetical protein CMI32_00825, partial [Opitutales bacterium]|nr:hypothetical protein [Opitutales bacterium]